MITIDYTQYVLSHSLFLCYKIPPKFINPPTSPHPSPSSLLLISLCNPIHLPPLHFLCVRILVNDLDKTLPEAYKGGGMVWGGYWRVGALCNYRSLSDTCACASFIPRFTYKGPREGKYKEREYFSSNIIGYISKKKYIYNMCIYSIYKSMKKIAHVNFEPLGKNVFQRCSKF